MVIGKSAEVGHVTSNDGSTVRINHEIVEKFAIENAILYQVEVVALSLLSHSAKLLEVALLLTVDLVLLSRSIGDTKGVTGEIGGKMTTGLVVRLLILELNVGLIVKASGSRASLLAEAEVVHLLLIEDRRFFHVVGSEKELSRLRGGHGKFDKI